MAAFRAACGLPLGEGIGIAAALGKAAWNEDTWKAMKSESMKKWVPEVDAVVVVVK